MLKDNAGLTPESHEYVTWAEIVTIYKGFKDLSGILEEWLNEKIRLLPS